MNNQTAIQPTPEQIAVYAYLIWEKEGQPHGRHTAHLFQAERQLKADCTQDASLLRRPATAASSELVVNEEPRPKRRNISKRLEVVAA